jgi:hypothetical protein
MINLEDASTFLCFMLLGSGTNWVLPTALVQEVPRLQKTHPEGNCMASYMNGSVNAGTHCHSPTYSLT